MKILRFLLVFLAVLFAIGCEKKQQGYIVTGPAPVIPTTPTTPTTPVEPLPVPVTSVRISPTSLSLQTAGTGCPNTTGQLTAIVSPSNAPQGVNWISSNASIAVISSSGLVTAMSVGRATITLESMADPTKIATLSVNVTACPVVTPPPPVVVTSVRISPSSLSLQTAGTGCPNTTGQLTAIVSPSNAPQGVSWVSSNAGIAAVSGSGMVTAVSAGRTTITARSTSDTTKFITASVSVTTCT